MKIKRRRIARFIGISALLLLVFAPWPAPAEAGGLGTLGAGPESETPAPGAPEALIRGADPAAPGERGTLGPGGADPAQDRQSPQPKPIPFKAQTFPNKKIFHFWAYQNNGALYFAATDLAKILQARLHRYRQSSSLVLRLGHKKFIEARAGENILFLDKAPLSLKAPVLEYGDEILIPAELTEHILFSDYAGFEFELAEDDTVKIFPIQFIELPEIKNNRNSIMMTTKLPPRQQYEIEFYPAKEAVNASPRLQLRLPFAQLKENVFSSAFGSVPALVKVLKDDNEKALIFEIPLPPAITLSDVEAQEVPWPAPRLIINVITQPKPDPKLTPMPPVTKAPALPEKKPMTSQMTPTHKATKTPAPAAAKPPATIIFLDPGHGGLDSGTMARSGLKEKIINLELAKKLQQELKHLLPNTRVMLSRTQDKTLKLESRPYLAKNHKANIFISIHANASETRHKGGYEIYIPKTVGFGAPKAQTGHISQSAKLAHHISLSLDKSISGKIKNRGIRRENFVVLRETQMPSVLIEAGFLTNQKDEKWLKNPRFQKQFAQAVAKGIAVYLKNQTKTPPSKPVAARKTKTFKAIDTGR